MRALTIFLSRLIGLFAILVSLAMVLHRQSYVETAATLIHDRPLLLVLGMISLIAGLAMARGHRHRLRCLGQQLARLWRAGPPFGRKELHRVLSRRFWTAPLPKLTIDAVGKLTSDEARNSKENPRIGGERGGSAATKNEARKTLTVSELVVRAHFRSSGEHTATVDRDMRVGAKAAEELLEANGAWTR